ncbi:MAG: zinc-dependent peptidase [Saprospiraceae bacterium]|nr:zinc-dependent peptidase [Saprospiraceae bacterium]
MKSFANLVALPLILTALFFLYLAWAFDSDYAIWMTPFVVSAAVVYVFSPQINWWWFSKHPPELDEGQRRLLERFHGFYRRLTETDKKRFRERTAMFMLGTDWDPLAFPEDDMPADVQLGIAAQAVMIAFKKEEFLFHKFEKVIVYPFPFPTPEYPFNHASELYEADGCLLFSAEQVMLAYLQPAKWYNIAVHEYARAFAITYPDEAYPALDGPEVWDHLEKVSGIPRDRVEAVIGLTDVPVLAVAIHHFFAFPERFQELMPAEYAQLKQIFA